MMRASKIIFIQFFAGLMLTPLESGINVLNIDLNMAAVNLPLPQNLKWLTIKYTYTEHLREAVFGSFYVLTKFPIAKGRFFP